MAINSKQIRTDLGKALKINLLENLDNRFKEIEDITSSPCFGITTLLDPRLKKVAFSQQEYAVKAEACVLDELAVLISEHANGMFSN